MMPLSNKFCLISTLLCFVLYGSCTNVLNGKLVGKWVNKEGKDTIELFKEGTVCARDNNIELCGDYRFVDEDRIRVRFGNKGEIEIFNLSISDNELTIFFLMGNPAVSERCYRKERLRCFQRKPSCPSGAPGTIKIAVCYSPSPQSSPPRGEETICQPSPQEDCVIIPAVIESNQRARGNLLFY